MTTEVIIVGAGIIGCACAFELSAVGARVTVFETRRAGQGASQASAGVLAPYIEGHEPGPLRELGARSLAMYDTFVQHAMRGSGLAVQYTRNGTLEVAFSHEASVKLRANAKALMAEGVQADWLDGPELREKEPLIAPAARAGLMVHNHGFVGVPDLIDALAAAAMRAGAAFAVDTRVISIDEGPGGRLAVQTENGISFADSVVIATGSWSGQVSVVDAVPPLVKPIRGQLLHLAWPTAQPLRHVLWGPGCYLVPWLSGRVLIGATVEDAGFDERATATGVAELLEAGFTLVPELKTATFTEVRVGLRPASPDGLPIVGRSAALPGVVYATGHYRNGVLLAPLTATLVKELVFERSDDPALAMMAPSRFGAL